MFSLVSFKSSLVLPMMVERLGKIHISRCVSNCLIYHPHGRIINLWKPELLPSCSFRQFLIVCKVSTNLIMDIVMMKLYLNQG
ncbi:hypothetical protein ILYODFUR_035236 [Ilyodon furcidens]|uniref:Uncharacterized protein n=1 Tax=Ilyodon furcidens TaxID=33524 RepID=A0ABV0T2S7_9TELE